MAAVWWMLTATTSTTFQHIFAAWSTITLPELYLARTRFLAALVEELKVLQAVTNAAIHSSFNNILHFE